MSLDQLRYFVAVAEAGTTRLAASRLHISQPPLSRQIKALEDELAAPLFERTPRGMKLLPAGEALLDGARTVLALLAETASQVTAMACGPAPEREPGASPREVQGPAPRI